MERKEEAKLKDISPWSSLRYDGRKWLLSVQMLLLLLLWLICGLVGLGQVTRVTNEPSGDQFLPGGFIALQQSHLSRALSSLSQMQMVKKEKEKKTLEEIDKGEPILASVNMR